MKKLQTSIILFLLISISGYSQKTEVFNTQNWTVNYQKTEGRFNGKYVSYYSNGQKKSEGTFENNMRAGTWSVWDTNGRLRIKRKYENPFVFTRVFPKPSNDPPVQLLNVPLYELKYNQEGIIPNYQVQERKVTWLRRDWRNINVEENPLLFNNNKLYNIINQSVFKGEIHPYSPISDQFESQLPLSGVDTNNLQIIQFKIKEEVFYDCERLISETRILGVCPVAVDNSTGDTTDLYWIYFPQLRPVLAKENVNSKDVPTKIKSYDDLFFYRYFYGQLSKVSNVHDQSISDYKSPAEASEEALKLDLENIEREHDIWIRMSK